jgi:hypothetical protein
LKRIVVRAVSTLAFAALAGGFAGCDNSTVLVVKVDVQDYSVPPFTQLAIKISSVADPTRSLSQMFISTTPGYGSEGGLPPIDLPQEIPFTIQPSYLSGPVLVEAQGLEIYSSEVLASGSATADVVANQEKTVTVTLHGLGGTCSADGGVSDAASPCDGGLDAASGGEAARTPS